MAKSSASSSVIVHPTRRGLYDLQCFQNRPLSVGPSDQIVIKSKYATCRYLPHKIALSVMETLVVDHPLVAHKLTTLRDVRTDSPTFRRLADELVTLLAYEATRDVRVTDVTVQT